MAVVCDTDAKTFELVNDVAGKVDFLVDRLVVGQRSSRPSDDAEHDDYDEPEDYASGSLYSTSNAAASSRFVVSICPPFVSSRRRFFFGVYNQHFRSRNPFDAVRSRRLSPMGRSRCWIFSFASQSVHQVRYYCRPPRGTRLTSDSIPTFGVDLMGFYRLK